MNIKSPLQVFAKIIWDIYEFFGFSLGRFAPIVFGWIIDCKGKRIK